jgi:ABC-type multidrug transport system ATPase subunit
MLFSLQKHQIPFSIFLFPMKIRTFVATMSTSIEIKKLTTGYKTKEGNKTIASCLNAELCSSEMVCLLGPNGAGKSTLLRTMAALQPALSGSI